MADPCAKQVAAFLIAEENLQNAQDNPKGSHDSFSTLLNARNNAKKALDVCRAANPPPPPPPQGDIQFDGPTVIVQGTLQIGRLAPGPLQVQLPGESTWTADLLALVVEHKTEVKRLWDQATAQTALSATLEGRVAALESRVNGLDTKTKNMEARINTLEGRINTTDSKVTSVETQLKTQLKQAVDQLNAKLQTLEARLNGAVQWIEAPGFKRLRGNTEIDGTLTVHGHVVAEGQLAVQEIVVPHPLAPAPRPDRPGRFWEKLIPLIRRIQAQTGVESDKSGLPPPGTDDKGNPTE